MSSEVFCKDILFVGNAHNRQRGSGHSAVLSKR
jgi:hypothetical protein